MTDRRPSGFVRCCGLEARGPWEPGHPGRFGSPGFGVRAGCPRSRKGWIPVLGGLNERTCAGRMIVMGIHVAIDPQAIAAFCRRHGIRRLSLFGSVLRDDFRPESDVDVLVEYGPNRPVGFAILDMEEDLSKLLGGRRVDVIPTKYLNRRLRERVLAEAETLHAEG
jgi:predicted nucleotidyltransferase